MSGSPQTLGDEEGFGVFLGDGEELEGGLTGAAQERLNVGTSERWNVKERRGGRLDVGTLERRNVEE